MGRKSGILQLRARSASGSASASGAGTIVNASTNVTEGRLGEMLERRGLLSAHDLARGDRARGAREEAPRAGPHRAGRDRREPARGRDRPPRPRQPGPGLRPGTKAPTSSWRSGGPCGRRRDDPQALHGRADPGGGAGDQRSRRGALRPRRHRPRAPALARPAAALPEHHALLRPTASCCRGWTARTTAREIIQLMPLARGGDAAEPLRAALHGHRRVRGEEGDGAGPAAEAGPAPPSPPRHRPPSSAPAPSTSPPRPPPPRRRSPLPAAARRRRRREPAGREILEAHSSAEDKNLFELLGIDAQRHRRAGQGGLLPPGQAVPPRRAPRRRRSATCATSSRRSSSASATPTRRSRTRRRTPEPTRRGCPATKPPARPCRARPSPSLLRLRPIPRS